MNPADIEGLQGFDGRMKIPLLFYGSTHTIFEDKSWHLAFYEESGSKWSYETQRAPLASYLSAVRGLWFEHCLARAHEDFASVCAADRDLHALSDRRDCHAQR